MLNYAGADATCSKPAECTVELPLKHAGCHFLVEPGSQL